MRREYHDITIHSVEEMLSDPIGGMRSQDDPFQPPVADLSLVDYRWEFTNTQAVEKVREVMTAEGHFVGTSSGAIVQAAQEALSRFGGTAVTLLPDAGWKYLSGSPWADGL